MLKKRDLIVYFLILVIAGTLYIGSASQVQRLRDRLDPTQTVSALQVSPEVLEILCGDFKSLAADYLLLKASVYLGGRYSNPEAEKKAVTTLFRQSTVLDPWFFQTCYFVQGYLPWWKGEYVKQAINILEISKDHRYWDWQPCFDIGFDYYFFLKDNLTASRYLMEASERPGAAKLVGLLGARLAQRGGETKASIAFLKTMLAKTEQERAREEIERRIEALDGILILEKAIAQFKSMFFNHPPDTLDRLVEVGILEALPSNPFGKNGLYHYEDGKLNF